MGKNKKNHSAPAAAGSSGTKAIDEPKNLNDQLVKEVTECRKQIEQLQFQLAALASRHNITAASKHNISSLAERHRDVSSSLTEAVTHENAEIVVKKTESAAAQLDAAEMMLLAVVREKDDIQSNMERIIAEKDCTIPCLEESLEQSRKKSEILSNMERVIADKDCTIRCMEHSLEQLSKKSDAELAAGRKWKRWICSVVVATAAFGVAAAMVTLCCPKCSNPKN